MPGVASILSSAIYGHWSGAPAASTATNKKKHLKNNVQCLHSIMYLSIPEAVAGPTPFSVVRALIAPFKFGNFLNAFFDVCITAVSVFIRTKSNIRARFLPLHNFHLVI